MLQNTFLDFDILDTHNCGTFAILDISYYSPLAPISGGLIQVLVPGYLNPIELYYTQSGITLLNSNNLGVTNVIGPENYIDLPDGAYVIKMSACPDLWTEKIVYRTCKIDCKYDKAILLLNLNQCSTCYNASLAQKLQTIQLYIQGCNANARVGDINQATILYNVANKMLDDIINCNCWNHSKESNNIW